MNNDEIYYYRNLLDHTLLKIVKIISRKSREPTYRESFIIIWLEELSDLQLNKSLYMCPTYQEIFKYKKKGLEIFVRVRPNPTYRVSDLSSLPVYMGLGTTIILVIRA